MGVPIVTGIGTWNEATVLVVGKRELIGRCATWVYCDSCACAFLREDTLLGLFRCLEKLV
jgi:hypothetical protein